MMISRDDVIAAYRLFLAREPENQDVVKAAVERYAHLEQLSDAFIHSDEFASRIAPLILARRFPWDLDRGPRLIEVGCAATALRELLLRIEQTWTKLGKEDPYWSVLTNDAFKHDNFLANEERFWDSGQHDVLRFRRWLERNKLTVSSDASCLEYGCGTGRVTRWLAPHFRSVTACDISEAHLRLARSAVPAKAEAHIEFLRISRLATLDELPPFDVLFSVIVLQHNPPPIIAYILDKLLARLRPGGIAYFQVPTFIAGYSFSVEEYLRPGSGHGETMEMHVIPQQFVFQTAARNACIPVEIEPDNMAGSLNAISTTFLFQKQHVQGGS